MDSSQFEIVPRVGWADIKLGDSLETVQSVISQNEFDRIEQSDPFTIEIATPESVLSFDQKQKLSQIVFCDSGFQIRGMQLIGQQLREAITALRVSSFDDTIWSMVSIEEELREGRFIKDSKRITRCQDSEKIQSGTLWIKSQGLGLVLHEGRVISIAMRYPELVPKIGCGRLENAIMSLALKQETLPIASKPSTTKKSDTKQKQIDKKPFVERNWWCIQVLMCLLIVGFLGTPLFLYLRQNQEWANALQTKGRVVEVKPEGPFPDTLIVEYQGELSQKQTVAIPVQYSSARAVDEEVELVYRKDRSDQAMTRIQAKEQASSVSAFALFGGPIGAVICFWIAFGHKRSVRNRRVIRVR